MNNKKNYKYQKHKRYSLLQSFSFAFQGICFAIFWERNLRIHLSVALLVNYFALRYYSFSRAEFAILMLSIAIVITCELFNTAIEKTVDLFTPDYNPLAKIAKDVAAGAVLVSSIGSLIVGVYLFWNLEIFRHIIVDILSHFYIWVPILIVDLILILLPEKTMKEENYD